MTSEEDKTKSRFSSSTWSMLGGVGTQILIVFSFIPRDKLESAIGKKNRILAASTAVAIGVAALCAIFKSWSLSREEKHKSDKRQAESDVFSTVPLSGNGRNCISSNDVIASTDNHWQERVSSEDKHKNTSLLVKGKCFPG